MKQRAVKSGVLASPYRFVEAGEEFDYPERMNWAVPVEEPVAEAAAPVEPPARAARKRVKPEPEVADDSAEDVI